MSFQLKREEQRGKSALKELASANGRLSKEKQLEIRALSANLAASWAAGLQTLLTHTKETEGIDLLTEITSLTILLIVQGGRESLTVRVLKQILESPSLMILIHPSTEARLMAQSTEATFVWMGR